MANKTKKLNPMQRKFANEYIKTGKVTESALKAGYSKNTASSQGSKLLKNVKVKEYIDFQLNKISDNEILEVEEILKFLTKQVLDESNKLPDRIRCAEDLAKYKGLEKIYHTGEIEHKHSKIGALIDNIKDKSE